MTLLYRVDLHAAHLEIDPGAVPVGTPGEEDLTIAMEEDLLTVEGPEGGLSARAFAEDWTKKLAFDQKFAAAHMG